jgi:hypothetical protein
VTTRDASTRCQDDGTFFLCFHDLSVARMLFLTGWWDDALTEISSARALPDHLGLTVHLDGLAALIAPARFQCAYRP